VLATLLDGDAVVGELLEEELGPTTLVEAAAPPSPEPPVPEDSKTTEPPQAHKTTARATGRAAVTETASRDAEPEDEMERASGCMDPR